MIHATNLRLDAGVAVLEMDSPPVNALNPGVRAGLMEGLRQALSDASVRAVVIAGAGRAFSAGFDIAELDAPPEPPGLHDIFGVMDRAEKPIVAAIHGVALGGGLELALACHHRIAAGSARLGLPEVTLGLLPGAGGTQRAPRLIGAAAALELMVSGKPITAQAALAMGLVDAVTGEADLRAEAIRAALALADQPAALRRTRELAVDVSAAEAGRVSEDYARKNPGQFRGFRAPRNIARAIAAAAALPFDAGIEREAELFFELLESRESAALRHLFFAERATVKVPDVTRDTPRIPISSVAVIGAGTMGSGISLAFLNAGFPVTLVDVQDEALARAQAHIKGTLQASAAKGRLEPAEAEKRLANLKTATDLSAIGQVDLVVEAVFERLDLKASVFAQVDAAAKPGAILASNTSFLDLDEIAAATSRPQDVVGLHFFAPANIMRLLEVVRGAKTALPVIATAMDLGRKLAKIPVLSTVCDGFIANRAMVPRTLAADRLILEGALPWEIDQALTDFGFSMGLYAMLDLVGLDVVGWDRENSAGRTVQEVLCESGRWGQKRGGGYYDYDEQRRARPSTVTEQIIQDLRARAGRPQRKRENGELIGELLFPIVNEGARLLEEGVALRASDIDVALVTGYGWPTWTGGPMFWADTVGAPAVLNGLRAQQAAGADIIISPLLENVAANNGAFANL